MTSTLTFDELCDQRCAAERRRDAIVAILMPTIEPSTGWPRMGPSHPALAEFEEVSKEIECLDAELDRVKASH